MILQIYTIIHTNQSDRNLYRHCGCIWNARQSSTRRLDEMVSHHSSRDNDHRILLPVPWIHAGDRSRDYLAAFSRADDLCALPEASRRRMALGLRDWCGHLSLFQSFRPNRTVV